jgi:small subunit ribosomal protein S6
MVRYEALVLAVPEITADEVKSIESQLGKAVVEKKGTLLSFERWGKYRLAYPIVNNDYGVYFLARFESTEPTAITEEVKNLFAVKLHGVVMRHMITKLELDQSLAYQRPQSLEEAPSREESFFKDNKSDSHMSDDSDDSDDQD